MVNKTAELNTDNLITIQNQQVVTSSLVVAETFEKTHNHVLRDIDALKGVVQNWTDLFYEDSYVHPQNKQTYRMYYMNRDGFTLLAMGFTGKKALQFKIAYINQFNKMEEQLKQLSSPSYLIDDPIKRAEKWIEEQKEKQTMLEQNLLLEAKVEEDKPKVEFCDKVLQSETLLTVTQIAKDYGLTARKLNSILKEQGVQYYKSGQWHLYAEYANKGYAKSETYIDHKGEANTYTKWTQAGRLFIHELLKYIGINVVTENVHK